LLDRDSFEIKSALLLRPLLFLVGFTATAIIPSSFIASAPLLLLTPLTFTVTFVLSPVPPLAPLSPAVGLSCPYFIFSDYRAPAETFRQTSRRLSTLLSSFTNALSSFTNPDPDRFYRYALVLDIHEPCGFSETWTLRHLPWSLREYLTG
jgi:hypothetical protein